MQKVRRRAYKALRLLVDLWFQVLFHSPLGVLFTFPSRYLSSIGHSIVFSLGEWSPQIPSGFHVSVGTREHPRASDVFDYGAITLSCRSFQILHLTSRVPYRGPTTPPAISYRRFRLFPVRSPLLGKSRLISFPDGTEMFHFPSFASTTYVFSSRYQKIGEFPHSEIFGSKCVCHSPKLIAAYHVLHRL
jgi:hypothetical protein